MAESKILVVHANKNNAEAVFQKLRKLNIKSGPFANIFVLGDIQSIIPDIDIEGLSTIFTISSGNDDRTNEIKTNLIELNGFGVYELSNKLRIGYIGLNESQLKEQNTEINEKFNKVKQPVDIFITREWSMDIAKLKGKLSGNKTIDAIAKKLQPKYHFTYSDPVAFFELDPFKWDSSERITRFINIAEFGSPAKWAYAFNIKIQSEDDDEDDDDESVPDNLISNPYETMPSKKRPLEKEIEDANKGLDRKSALVKKARTVLPSSCHFCFTNPNLEDHMILSISNNAYVTIAKGPLTVPHGEMDFSGHCLIIPIEHIPKLNFKIDSSTTSTDTATNNIFASPLALDFQTYERSLVSMNYKKFDMCTIVFEINSDRSIHFHKQVLPIPKYLIMKFQEALDRQVYINNEKFTRNRKLELETFESSLDEKYMELVNDSSSNYLQFTVYETPETDPKIYVARFNSEDRIDLQFGRRVIAFLLRLPKRVKWDSQICQQTKEQEIKEVEKFQKAYKDYDTSESK
ncbi:Drn1p NDAI_0G01270 [Naumovozyma dairenensis CBS 421]|uniref:Cwf19-like C-terminal domain-containing protein n=1 Tax=Naumovozyma dairenensis (strain ATCC 10597 / BCRC 20456 / CBS 421 / NBRC 0211 / NRRL Y-12639) TaxID=1071378 RepID=G0WDP2_NAUDC|nr:hypothetical protein NDAI_0G01270 [Naumovozyma dairenensis CBS 421]CCD25903.2 hypothetical protein NDAI_0G01270 [Naumovozyma dairenensis CBS 421]